MNVEGIIKRAYFQVKRIQDLHCIPRAGKERF